MSNSRPIKPGDGDPRHGSVNGYRNLRCSCDACKGAVKQQKVGLPDPDDPRHGKASSYGNYGCRCKECTTAWTTYCADQRNRGPRRKSKTAA